jgi:hypothetical protein
MSEDHLRELIRLRMEQATGTLREAQVSALSTPYSLCYVRNLARHCRSSTRIKTAF